MSCHRRNLLLFINPSAIRVLSPSIDRYFGSLALELIHLKLKSNELGSLKSNQIEQNNALYATKHIQ